KLLRKPSRGALGNGLRVVAGAVLASGGHLAVTTRNRKLALVPQDTGETVVAEVTTAWRPVGTKVEVELGPAVPTDGLLFRRSVLARAMLHGKALYKGKSSPWWYDADSFFELLQATNGGMTVRELVEQLDGCTGARAGAIAAPFKGRACVSLSCEEALR